jgi:hypothetical protein
VEAVAVAKEVAALVVIALEQGWVLLPELITPSQLVALVRLERLVAIHIFLALQLQTTHLQETPIQMRS